MFAKIDDVPAVLAAFYTAETHSVQQFNEDQTPVTKEIEYQYPDENGDLQTGTCPEPVFVAVDVVVPVPVGERKSWDDVWRIVGRHKGTRDDLIRQFLGMVCNAQQWA
ncbi:hypothetical protein VV869_23860, partial [Photobacterium sp. MCCC 1A19761]|uniref:hypothetical protein n=1 Tax=Photobacterium sp. MCCC 1A19761 TaxID=3115000 RepID=UPI00307F9834